jgi:hypothetical protein
MIRRQRETTRLEAFSDAVFAFSATLLVVSLEVPTTFPALVAELKGFAAFGVSFVALVLIWSVHNAFFRRYGLDDRLTVAINSVLLFVVLFYVYPLKFLVEGLVGSVMDLGSGGVTLSGVDELGLLFMLYSGGFVAVFGGFAALYLHAYRSRRTLGLTSEEEQEALFYCRHYLIFVVMGLLSVLMARLGAGVQVGAPGFVYSLLGPLCYAHGAISARQWRAGEANRVNMAAATDAVAPRVAEAGVEAVPVVMATPEP